MLKFVGVFWLFEVKFLKVWIVDMSFVFLKYWENEELFCRYGKNGRF